MSTKFIMTRDINGYNGFGLPFCEATSNFNTILAANVAQSFVVPDNYAKWIMILSPTPGAGVWVARNTAATRPGGSFANSASQQNPQAREVYANDVISIITGDATNVEVNVSLYAL